MVSKNTYIVMILIIAVGSFIAFTTFDLTGYVTKTGSWQIGNSIPTANYIYLNGLLTSDTAADVTINPLENTTRNITVKLTITDLNGDCDRFTSNNGTAYFCNSTTEVCNSTTADHTVNLAYNATDGQWGVGDRYCNLSGLASDFYFYEVNGSWRVNVTVTDGVNTSAHNVKNWTYGELPAFSYASGGTVFMGTMTLGQWNNGTGVEEVRNTGNIVVDLAWNATNFTGTNFGNTLNISGDNFIIDDDTNGSDDTANLPMQFINETSTVQETFIMASGLRVCNATACANENSTFDVYWHLDVPSGLSEDTYTNSIGIESSYH